MGDHAEMLDICNEDDFPYGQWIADLNGICIRFLDIELENFPAYWEDTYEWFKEGVPPECYFRDKLMPELRTESGHDFIDRIVAQMTKFGYEVGRKI